MKNRERQRENRRRKNEIDPEKIRCSRTTCNNHMNGLCLLLEDTDFNGRPCPFHKTKAEFEEGRAAAHQRLVAMGRSDLLAKYHGGKKNVN